jgi:hypothetical protein
VRRDSNGHDLLRPSRPLFVSADVDDENRVACSTTSRGHHRVKFSKPRGACVPTFPEGWRPIRRELPRLLAIAALILAFFLAPGCSAETNAAAACGALLLMAFIVAALAVTVVARIGAWREWAAIVAVLALLAILITLCCVVLVPSSSSP